MKTIMSFEETVRALAARDGLPGKFTLDELADFAARSPASAQKWANGLRGTHPVRGGITARFDGTHVHLAKDTRHPGRACEFNPVDASHERCSCGSLRERLA